MKPLAPALAALFALSACASVPPPPVETAAPVEVRIIGINDFHGNLEPLRRPVTFVTEQGEKASASVGGAAWLASEVKQRRAQSAHSLVIAAGDLIGASPLASSYFLDEPAIGVMNRLGLDFNAVGNHEFDRGWRELQRIQRGGCEKLTLREPCAIEQPYGGATFPFLAANVVQPDGSTLFPPYAIRRFREGEHEVALGVIGLTLKDTPNLVTPSGVDGLEFRDEAASINQAVAELADQGVEAIVVAIHQGFYTEVGFDDKSCGGVSGPLIDILKQVDPRVDLVISGHTHWAYVCDFAAIDPARHFWVTSAGYGGSLLTDIALEIDPATGDARVTGADNVVIQSTGGQPPVTLPGFAAPAPDPDVAAYVARYVAASRGAAERPVGRIGGDARKPGSATEETPLGNAIADAQLQATRAAGAQIALMNNSGIRAGISPAPDGTVTFGDIYTVQPFANQLITRTYTGTQLLALLEQQFDDAGFVQTFSISAGLAFSYDLARPLGQRIVSATLDGQPIDPAGEYRVTMNSFLAAGGDSFTIFVDGSDAVVGPVDLDAFEEWLAAEPLRALPPEGRITDLTNK